MSAAAAAARVRPAVADPFIVDGSQLALDLTVTALTGERPHLRVHLAPREGSAARHPDLGELQPGRDTYRAGTPGCAGGCRVASVEVAQPGQVEFTVDVDLHRLTQVGPDRDVVPRFADWLASRQQRTEDTFAIRPASDGGAALHVVASSYGTLDGRLRPPDAVYPLPAVAAGPATQVLRGLDQRELRDISRRAMRPSTKDEREQGAGPMLRDLDSSNMLTVATAMLDPDLSGRSAESQALLQKYGPGPEGVIKQWFAPGEITQMADRVMELSGWSDEALTRAKNS
jgi:hypothetical protein